MHEKLNIRPPLDSNSKLPPGDETEQLHEQISVNNNVILINYEPASKNKDVLSRHCSMCSRFLGNLPNKKPFCLMAKILHLSKKSDLE